MVDAKALVHTQQDALKSAVFWVESKLDLLESNQGSLRDVLDGLFQFLQARLVAEMAVYDYDVAVAALERTSGLALVPVASAAGDR